MDAAGLMLAWRGRRSWRGRCAWQVKLPDGPQFFSLDPPSNPFLAEAPLFDPSPSRSSPPTCAICTTGGGSSQRPAGGDLPLRYAGATSDRGLPDYCPAPDWPTGASSPDSFLTASALQKPIPAPASQPVALQWPSSGPPHSKSRAKYRYYRGIGGGY